MIINIILNDKKIIYDKGHIELFEDINFHEADFIDMPDICNIFSNMIGNAIEAYNKVNSNGIGKILNIG